MTRKNHLQRARRHARLGLPIPEAAKHRLIKRVVLKLTWFTTSHQMDHNIAIVKAVGELTHEVASLREQIVSHRHHVARVLAEVEASLRAEILGSDRRGDLIEADLMRLSVAVSSMHVRLDAMMARLDDVEGHQPQAEDPDVTDQHDAVVAAVRRLPGHRST